MILSTPIPPRSMRAKGRFVSPLDLAEARLRKAERAAIAALVKRITPRTYRGKPVQTLEERRAKKRAYQAKYRKARSRAAVNAYRRAYYAAHAEQEKANRRRWRGKNVERARAINARGYARNAEKRKAYARAYYQRNREKILAKMRAQYEPR